MPFIDHRCDCGHLLSWHRHHARSPACTACSCKRGSDSAPPELIPTIPPPSQEPAPLTRPGEPWAYPDLKTCDCDRCQALYRELTR